MPKSLDNRSRNWCSMLLSKRSARARGKKTSPCSCGKLARYKGDYARRIVTLHDKVCLYRAYYYCGECKKGFCPLDQVLDLGTGAYTARVVGLISRFSSYLPFRKA